MRSLILAAAAAAAAAAGAANTTILLGRGNSLLPWTLGYAQPGNLTLATDGVTPWSGLPYLNVSWDFTAGGWSVLTQLATPQLLDVPAPEALVLSAFAPNTSLSLTVQIIDGSGQSLGCWPYLAPGWTNVTIALNASSWLPAGKPIVFPLKSLAFGIGKQTGDTVGWAGFADVALVSGAQPGAIPGAVSMALVQPAGVGDGVAVAGQLGPSGLAIGVQATNRLIVPCDADLVVQMRNGTGAMGEGAGGFDGWTTCSAGGSIAGWDTVTWTCPIPADAPPGYVFMRAAFNATNGNCATANDTLQVVEGGVSIVIPQAPVAPVQRNNYSAVFGGQMINSAAASAAIGMLTVREGPLWRWAQPADCWNATSCFDWHFYDGIMDDAAGAGLWGWMGCRCVALR